MKLTRNTGRSFRSIVAVPASVVATVLIVSACANSVPEASAPSSVVEVVALSNAGGPVTSLSPSALTPSTTGRSSTTLPSATQMAPNVAFVLPQKLLDDLAIAANTSTVPPSITQEPLDTRAPAPTVPAVPGNPASQYQGFLGTLGLDTPVAPAVAPAPVAQSGTHPLTGLPGAAQNRAALVVKIDNSENARPHTGLDAADLIIEEEVEGGITRLAAVFHSGGGDIGPVRSGRTTDISYLSGLGRPILAYSGANDLTETMLRRQELVQNLGAMRFGAYWRSSRRRAPHNLYTSASDLWGAAQASMPPAQFTYRSEGTASRGRDAAGAVVSFPSVAIDWAWTGDAWSRTQRGTPHTLANGGVLTAANVVVVEVAEIPTGMKDSSGAVVPEFVFVGNGPATVLSDGKAVSGVWTRPTLRDAATLTRGDGSVIELTPGVTWIEIVTTGAVQIR